MGLETQQWILKSNWLASGAYKNPALQFSGGKDSLATLHLLKPHWPELTIIFANQGDPFPETLETVEALRGKVKDVVIVYGNSSQAQTYAFPVDMLPLRSTPLGMAIEPDGNQIRLRSRYECCTENFWSPMALKTKELGIDLLIRGQRRDETLRTPAKSGDIEPVSGAPVWMPIEDWTAQEVKGYLKDQGVPLPRFYESMDCSVDCMLCTAYLKDTRGKVDYLRKYHPLAAKEYERRLGLVAQAILPDVNELQASLQEINHG